MHISLGCIGKQINKQVVFWGSYISYIFSMSKHAYIQIILNVFNSFIKIMSMN